MPLLQVNPTVCIQAGGYEATISPSAGARLLKLTYSYNNRIIDCVVPFAQVESIDAHHWPKAGAFVMLPFTNRLAPAEFEWQGRLIALENGSNTGQGLHGFGHRRDWIITDTSDSQVALECNYTASSAEWPWTFHAKLVYSVSALGLSVALSVRNTAISSMPVSLGWHPFIPLQTSNASENSLLSFTASRMHDIGLDGLGFAQLSEATANQHVFTMDAKTANTTAFENFSKDVEIFLEKNLRLKLVSQHAPHLLVHRPKELPFICVEPVGSLPGALKHYTQAQKDRELSLAAGEWKHLICSMGLEAVV
jgi:aldose 1-epimerase